MNRIPKLAYFYWGGETLPYLRFLTLKSFKKFNPSWNMTLYVPKKLQKELSWVSSEHKKVIPTQDYFSCVSKLGINVVEFDMEKIGLSNDLSEVHKSDYLRWHLLGTVGGIWSDLDIIYFQPISKIVEDCQTLVCFRRGVWSIGLLGSCSNNKFYQDIFEAAKQRTDNYRYQYVGCILVRQVHGNIFTATQKFSSYKIKNILDHTVYPLPPSRTKEIYVDSYNFHLSPDTIGLHWFAGHEESAKWMSLLNHTNVSKYNNLLIQCIRRAGV